MSRKTVESILIAGAVSANIANAESRSDKEDRELLEWTAKIMLSAECSEDENFDLDQFNWQEYEILGLEFIITNILNNTKNFCSPPDFTGMHAMQRQTNEDTKTQK